MSNLSIIDQLLLILLKKRYKEKKRLSFCLHHVDGSSFSILIFLFIFFLIEDVFMTQPPFVNHSSPNQTMNSFYSDHLNQHASVAIVGMGCMFPQASTLHQFWKNIMMTFKISVHFFTDKCISCIGTYN